MENHVARTVIAAICVVIKGFSNEPHRPWALLANAFGETMFIDHAPIVQAKHLSARRPKGEKVMKGLSHNELVIVFSFSLLYLAQKSSKLPESLRFRGAPGVYLFHPLWAYSPDQMRGSGKRPLSVIGYISVPSPPIIPLRHGIIRFPALDGHRAALASTRGIPQPILLVLTAQRLEQPHFQEINDLLPADPPDKCGQHL